MTFIEQLYVAKRPIPTLKLFEVTARCFMPEALTVFRS